MKRIQSLTIFEMWKILGALLCSFVLAIAADTCSITLPGDLEGFAPILLTRPSAKSNYQLFKPTGQTSHLSENSKLFLACTGSKNVIVSLRVATLELQCSGGNFVDSNNNDYNLTALVCKSIPSSTLKLTSEPCSLNRGYIFESGFTVESKFYGPVFEICYDNVTETTHYTHNVINGAAINFNIKESTRRSFSAEGMKLTTTKTNNYYTQKNQETRFKDYFGDNQTYIAGSNYLARGHLTPDADFIFGYEQLSTYYYANVGPEYQPINAGNWLRVEELARSTAASYATDIHVYTGYLDVLQLSKDNGDLVDIYLDDGNQIEVPRYFFKVLLEKSTDAAIVFVTVNNPFITDGGAEEICESVCDTAELKHYNFPILSKGYTFCCRLEDFKLYYNGLPAEVQASKLLTKKN